MAAATVLALMAGGAVADEVMGTICSIDLTRRTFTVEGKTFTASPNNTVGVKLEELKDGDTVRVRCHEHRDRQAADQRDVAPEGGVARQLARTALRRPWPGCQWPSESTGPRSGIASVLMRTRDNFAFGSRPAYQGLPIAGPLCVHVRAALDHNRRVGRPAERAASAISGPSGSVADVGGWPGTYQSRAYSQTLPAMSNKP